WLNFSVNSALFIVLDIFTQYITFFSYATF
ncbi:MAG: hypothetical protein ACJA01_001674, partial [Saprospiraceae bacterium]